VLRPQFCLIIDEDAHVGLDLADALEAQGYFVAGPFTSGREALNWLTRFTPDIAVVGTLVREKVCAALVEALQDRGIPVVLHSADRFAESALPLVTVTWFDKPYLIADLINLLLNLSC
jgi:chemotaxis response regulator CheB